MSSSQLTFISLFSGIGGLDLGLERAGMRCVAQVEIDNYCRKVLQKHWPSVPKYKDVYDVGKHNLPTADLICGGFPCQPHSLAGGRKASQDERDLWPEFIRVVCECRPRWFMAENVPGLLSSDAGRFFGRVLADLAASGYDAEWQSLPAAAFGAPHIRERVFIVAHREGEGGQLLSGLSAQSSESFSYPVRFRKVVPDANGQRLQDQCQPVTVTAQGARVFSNFEYCGEWEAEPNVGRVVDGFPGRVDRLRGLGNAVVPCVAEWVGRQIVRYDNENFR